MGQVTESVGLGLAQFLTKPVRQITQFATISQEKLAATLQPGDVLLVEENARISVAIKYLTQSTWPHAALFIGDALLPALLGNYPRYWLKRTWRKACVQ